MSKPKVIQSVEQNQREAFALPIVEFESNDVRNKECKMYADLVWRETCPFKIAAILNGLYETAYGNGIKSNTDIFDKLK